MYSYYACLIILIQRISVFSFRYTIIQAVVVGMYYDYNRIKLLQFRVHISAELLSLSKKVICCLTSAFDVFCGLSRLPGNSTARLSSV